MEPGLWGALDKDVTRLHWLLRESGDAGSAGRSALTGALTRQLDLRTVLGGSMPKSDPLGDDRLEQVVHPVGDHTPVVLPWPMPIRGKPPIQGASDGPSERHGTFGAKITVHSRVD